MEGNEGGMVILVVGAPGRILTMEEIAKLELYDIEIVEKPMPSLPEEFFQDNLIDPMGFKELGKFLQDKKMDRILGRNKRK